MQANGERGHRRRSTCGCVASSDSHAALRKADPHSSGMSMAIASMLHTCWHKGASGFCCRVRLPPCCDGWSQATHDLEQCIEASLVGTDCRVPVHLLQQQAVEGAGGADRSRQCAGGPRSAQVSRELSAACIRNRPAFTDVPVRIAPNLASTCRCHLCAASS